MDASQSLGRRQNAAHLDSTTIVEASCSLSLRGTSGERAGERGTFHRIGAANWNPLSLTLSPLLCRGERESTSGIVVMRPPEREKPWPSAGGPRSFGSFVAKHGSNGDFVGVRQLQTDDSATGLCRFGSNGTVPSCGTEIFFAYSGVAIRKPKIRERRAGKGCCKRKAIPGQSSSIMRRDKKWRP